MVKVERIYHTCDCNYTWGDILKYRVGKAVTHCSYFGFLFAPAVLKGFLQFVTGTPLLTRGYLLVSFQVFKDAAFSANTCAKQLNISPSITDKELFDAGLFSVLPITDTNFTMPWIITVPFIWWTCMTMWNTYILHNNAILFDFLFLWLCYQ